MCYVIVVDNKLWLWVEFFIIFYIVMYEYIGVGDCIIGVYNCGCLVFVMWKFGGFNCFN